MTTPDQAAAVESVIPRKSISNRLRKSVQFLPHLCFVTALFFVVAPQHFTAPVSFFLLHKFISLALQVIPLAINYYVLVPLFFARKKWLYAGMLTKLIALFTLLNYWRFFSMDAVFVPSYVQPGEPVTTLLFLFTTMGIINIAALFFRVSSQRQKELEKKHRIEKANLESELQFLRLQLSPHFYFNVMNTIYHSIKLNPSRPKM
jgi:sensor histidine kinase YesM